MIVLELLMRIVDAPKRVSNPFGDSTGLLVIMSLHPFRNQSAIDNIVVYR